MSRCQLIIQSMLDQTGAKSVRIYNGLIQSGEPQIVPVLAWRRYQVMEFVCRSEHVCAKRLCLCRPSVLQAGQLGKTQRLTVGLIRVGDVQRSPLDVFQLVRLLDCQSSVPYLARVLGRLGAPGTCAYSRYPLTLPPARFSIRRKYRRWEPL